MKRIKAKKRNDSGLEAEEEYTQRERKSAILSNIPLIRA